MSLGNRCGWTQEKENFDTENRPGMKEKTENIVGETQLGHNVRESPARKHDSRGNPGSRKKIKECERSGLKSYDNRSSSVGCVSPELTTLIPLTT